LSREAPSHWVRRFAPLVAPGAAVLDLACGSGRHAVLFAARGCPVLAVDRDPDCGERLAGVAGVEFRRCDLEAGTWPLADRRFEAIIVTNYLHRPLWPDLARALSPGGLLVYETFADGQQRFGHPHNPLFLLRPGELLEAFAGVLQVVAYEDGVVESPRPARVQRLCALATAGLDAGSAAACARIDAPEAAVPAQ
jgi:SAM-dependent methyltransferase